MRITTLTLQNLKETSTGAAELTFSPARPLTFRAGQAGLVLVPGGGAKPFTFSGDARRQTLRIATTLRSGSRYKSALAALRPGDRVRVAGTLGSPPAPEPGQLQVLVAQGIGITPFLSMARTHDHLEAALLQVGTPHFFEETAAAVTAAEHHAHRGDLTAAVSRALGERPAARWSISGRPDFVATVAAQLRQAGVPRRRIHQDSFWTMRSSALAASSAPTGAPRAGALTSGVVS